MKSRHLPISLLLSLSTLPHTFGVDPRAASLHKRAPEPVISKIFSCCTRPKEPVTSDSDTEWAVVSDNPAEHGTPAAARPELEAQELRAYPANPTPYPTQLANPKFTDDGRRYLVAVVVIHFMDNMVLLVRDLRGTEGWRLPETDWGQDEGEISNAVSREVRETAGIEPYWNGYNEPQYLGERETNLWREPGAAKDVQATDAYANGARSHYWQFVAQKRNVLDEWSGRARWERKWARITQAEQLLANHPEHFEMLLKSDYLKPLTWPLKDTAVADARE